MSALAYNEPYKFFAGFWTLVVHALFFSVLYFGVNWSAQQPEGMQVDLWESLPEAENTPAPGAPPQKVESAKPQEAEKIAPPVQADIDLTEKKKPKPKEVVKTEPKKKPVSKAERRQSLAELEALGDMDEKKDRAKRTAQMAARGAAITSEVEKYIGLIKAKIKHNIVLPPDVADDAVAEFVVTLLPDGSVLEAKLRKSSGNSAYDDAAARAIKKAEPLPLPQDETARQQFINPNSLRLPFSPKD